VDNTLSIRVYLMHTTTNSMHQSYLKRIILDVVVTIRKEDHKAIKYNRCRNKK
jgi:hypothetical protein